MAVVGDDFMTWRRPNQEDRQPPSGARRSSAASALVNGRLCRIASSSSRATTARAAANERSIRIATIADQAFVDRELPVGEQLHQDARAAARRRAAPGQPPAAP